MKKNEKNTNKQWTNMKALKPQQSDPFGPQALGFPLDLRGRSLRSLASDAQLELRDVGSRCFVTLEGELETTLTFGFVNVKTILKHLEDELWHLDFFDVWNCLFATFGSSNFDISTIWSSDFSFVKKKKQLKVCFLKLFFTWLKIPMYLSISCSKMNILNYKFWFIRIFRWYLKGFQMGKE